MNQLGIFQKVRKALDENGYREVLPLESVSLVHHLLEDLKKATEDLKKKNASFKELKQKCDSLELSLAPFREENGRLLTETNQLHMENLKLREHNEKVHKEHENALHKLVNEKENLVFLVEELKRRISSLEEESQRKSEHILSLQDKNLAAVVVTPGGSKKQIASHRQRLETEFLLPEGKMTSHERCIKCGCATLNQKIKNKDVYLADLLRMTDKKLMILQEELETQKRKTFHSQQECAELEKKISNRDVEIERLQRLLDGGRPVEALLEDNKLLAAHTQLHQLKLQIDDLTETNSQLEHKLKSTLGHTHEAMNHAMEMVDVNTDLATELKDAASVNRRLKKDCSSTAETLSAQLARNKGKLKDCEDDLVEQHSLYHATRDERDQLKLELSRLSQAHSRLKEDMNRLVEASNLLKAERNGLEEVLARSQGERKNMADRINTLTVQLQGSTMECCRLKSEGCTLRSSIASLEEMGRKADAAQEALNQGIIKLNEQKRELELEKAQLRSELIKEKGIKEQLDQERSFFKNQSEELQEQKTSVEQARDYFSQDAETLKKQLSELRKAEEKLKEKFEDTAVALEETTTEKDHYSEQVIQLLDILKVKPAAAGAAQIAKSKLKPEEELGRALYERDVIRQERDFFKTQLQGLKRGKGEAAGESRPGRVVDQPPETRKQTLPSADEQVAKRTPAIAIDEATKESLETLRTERDLLQSQMEHFQQLYNEAKKKLHPPRQSPTPLPSSGGMSLSPHEEAPAPKGKEGGDMAALRYEMKATEREKEFFREQYEQLKASLGKPPDASSSEAVDVENLTREKKVLKEERDFYMKHYKELTAKITESFSPPSTKSDTTKRHLESLLAEKRSLALAKSQLEAQVSGLKEDLVDSERKNSEMAASKKALTKSFENMQNTAAQKAPASMQNFIAEIRKSRDAALTDAEKLREERDELKSKLKVLSSQQMREKSVAREDISTLQVQKGESEALAADLQERLQSQADLIASLQEQIQALQAALQQSQSELEISSKQGSQFKKLLQEKVGEADSQGQQLINTASQLSITQAKVTALENDVSRLEDDVVRLEAENQVLRRNVSKLDSDKDNLTTELDNKSEFIATLKNELKKRSSQIATLEAEAAKREATIQSCEMAIEMEQRKVADETKRCERLTQDLAITTEQRDAANREIRRLQKEMVGLGQDIKDLRAELEKTKACRENFKRKAQEYCRTLENMSSSITTKDKEQDSLMQQYLSLNETVSSLKILNASLEENAVTQNKELNRMEEMVKNFKEEREQLIADVNESLSKIEELEATCHRLKEEKFTLEKDILTTKDITQKVEMKRNEADCESRRLITSVEQLLEDKRNLELQIDSFAAQLQSERSALCSLEEILADKRKSEFIAETSLKQMQVEKTQLQRKVMELTSELESEVAEVKRLRSRGANLELEAERLRRQLTTEQYERERAAQELRRVRKYSQMEGALSLGEQEKPGPSPCSPSHLPRDETPGSHVQPGYEKERDGGSLKSSHKLYSSTCLSRENGTSYHSLHKVNGNSAPPPSHSDYPLPAATTSSPQASLTTEQYERERAALEIRRVHKYSRMEEALSQGEQGRSGPSPYSSVQLPCEETPGRLVQPGYEKERDGGSLKSSHKLYSSTLMSRENGTSYHSLHTVNGNSSALSSYQSNFPLPAATPSSPQASLTTEQYEREHAALEIRRVHKYSRVERALSQEEQGKPGPSPCSSLQLHREETPGSLDQPGSEKERSGGSWKSSYKLSSSTLLSRESRESSTSYHSLHKMNGNSAPLPSHSDFPLPAATTPSPQASLTTEQYERERAALELRRVRKYSRIEEALSQGEQGRSGASPCSSLQLPREETRGSLVQPVCEKERNGGSWKSDKLLSSTILSRENGSSYHSLDKVNENSSAHPPPPSHSYFPLLAATASSPQASLIETRVRLSPSSSKSSSSNPLFSSKTACKTFYSSFSPLPPSRRSEEHVERSDSSSQAHLHVEKAPQSNGEL